VGRGDAEGFREERMSEIEAIKSNRLFSVEAQSAEIESFCRRWRVRELALFGSAVRGEMRPDSDLDVLISFDQDAPWSLWDLIAMQDELTALFGRQVDLVEREALRNPYRRHRILSTRKVIYACRQG
jgi:predicted nucleotidyltransferase